MAETREEQIQEGENSKIGKIKEALDNIKNKKTKFLFFVTKTAAPSASIHEIYFHANVAKKMGYGVRILTDANDYEVPDWLDIELTDIQHESMENAKLSVGPQDVLVIPDIFSNVMEQTKNLPCIRVGLLQSIDYMMNGLVPATDWSMFGIKNIITTSNSLKQFVDEFFNKKFNVSVYDIGIPEYFKDKGEPKRPVISVVGRNQNEMSKVIKLFYAKYPQYGWITFDTMVTESKPPRALRRSEFAERLSKNFATLWLDRISSFGTLPLEAMASGSIPIALVPDLPPEYLTEVDDKGNKKYIDNSGVWTNDYYSLPILIGETLTKFLDDSIDKEVYDVMNNITAKYTQENSEESIKKVYEEILNERIEGLQKAIEDFENIPIEENKIENLKVVK